MNRNSNTFIYLNTNHLKAVEIFSLRLIFITNGCKQHYLLSKQKEIFQFVLSTIQRMFAQHLHNFLHIFFKLKIKKYLTVLIRTNNF